MTQLKCVCPGENPAALDSCCPLRYTERVIKESFGGCSPQTEKAAFIAAGAALVGDVRLAENVSVWYNVTLRADVAPIIIGQGTNVQDNSCIHVERGGACCLGQNVTVGHCVTLHACTVEDNCLIGMGAVVLDGAVIGHGSIVGAHALVTKGTLIPPGSLVLGSPAKVVRQLSPETETANIEHAVEYVKLACEYAAR